MTALRGMPRWLVGAVAVLLLLVVLLAAQGGADALAPTGGGGPGRSLGRTGDAYLSGLRVFAAYTIWNRIEPQFHGYYGKLPLKDQKFLMPNLRLVVLLDPQFVQAYYIVPFVLADGGRVNDALDVAREGVANNPRSGLLRMSYAQMLFIFKKDYAAAATQADLALGTGIEWRDPLQLWENLDVARDIYKRAGMTAKSESVVRAIAALEARYGGADKIPGDRDTDAPQH